MTEQPSQNPRVGDVAPIFTATDEQANTLHLSQFLGQRVVLFFFPRAAATHCQMQVRRFQALIPEFEAASVQVIGVSSDTTRRQVELRGLCQLSYPLIPDPTHQVSGLYGVLDDLEPGETVRCARRETFLVSPEGKIEVHWNTVAPHSHAAEVLQRVWEFQSPLLT